MFNENAYTLGENRCCIRDLHEYGCARAALVGEENVFDFSLGNPSIPAPPEVKEQIMAVLEEMDPLQIHGYTPAKGDLQLRQAIARDLNCRYGTQITPEELFIGCGAAPELTAVFEALAFPGAKILAIAPYFPEYRPFALQAGLTFEVVPADIPSFQISLEKLEEKLTKDTCAVIVNSPNNPSGAVYSEGTLRRLADLLERKSREFGHPVYIVADEPYRELVYGGVEATFIPSVYPDTVVCYSYSKVLSLPGERIGYIYVPAQAHDSKALYTAICGAARAMGHICAPSLMQKVVARCASLRPDLTEYDQNRKALWKGLTEAGYEVAKPEGAFYLFVRAPGGNANAFSRKAMKKDVLVVPGDDFGCPEYFRVCYCVSYDKILRSIPLFRELIEE